MIRRPPRPPLFPSTPLFRSTGRYRERQSVTVAGLLVGGVNVVMALALIAYSQQPMTWKTVVMAIGRSEEHTSELQSRQYFVCRLLLEKKKQDACTSKLSRSS